MVNQVVLVGRITRDLELKIGANNREVVSFSLAIQRDYKNSQGEYDTDFINCVAFGPTARFMDQYLAKGRLISVVGSLRSRSYENNQNQRVYVTEVIVNQVNPLESRKQAAQGNFTNDVDNAISASPYDFMPEQPATVEKDNGASPYDFMDLDQISDDDLPF